MPAAELPDVEVTVQRIESLLEAHPEAGELVQLLMQLYGAGLSRIIDMLRRDGSVTLLDKLAEDKLVASLMLLHDLHPVDVETRLCRALQRVERRLESQRLLLENLADGVALIRVVQEGPGTPPASLAEVIERAALESAPDLAGIEIVGIPPVPTNLVQIQLTSAP